MKLLLKNFFQINIGTTNKKNRWFHVAAIVLTGFVIGVHHTLASDYPTNFLFEFTMRTNLLIILLLAITFFPVHAYFFIRQSPSLVTAVTVCVYLSRSAVNKYGTSWIG